LAQQLELHPNTKLLTNLQMSYPLKMKKNIDSKSAGMIIQGLPLTSEVAFSPSIQMHHFVIIFALFVSSCRNSLHTMFRYWHLIKDSMKMDYQSSSQYGDASLAIHYGCYCFCTASALARFDTSLALCILVLSESLFLLLSHIGWLFRYHQSV
jgi:hypothetical protein